eukprot:1763082-Amphidinium_carterae.1
MEVLLSDELPPRFDIRFTFCKIRSACCCICSYLSLSAQCTQFKMVLDSSLHRPMLAALSKQFSIHRTFKTLAWRVDLCLVHVNCKTCKQSACVWLKSTVAFSITTNSPTLTLQLVSP